MSTAQRISISPDNTGLWNIKQSNEAAHKTGELLERDLQARDPRRSPINLRFVLHHILALYGTGASPSLLEKAYDLRDPLQRPVEPRHDAVVRDLLASWDNAIHYLGNEEHYPDFLAYFQQRIDAQGYEFVVQEHLLKGDAHADDLLTRLHAGVVHPLIQLMYGLEWKQPAIVAEALAQTCVHHIEGLDEL
ncbi:hypothetical protein FALCPG4_011437 [Fusarium falciforme]